MHCPRSGQVPSPAVQCCSGMGPTGFLWCSSTQAGMGGFGCLGQILGMGVGNPWACATALVMLLDAVLAQKHQWPLTERQLHALYFLLKISGDWYFCSKKESEQKR